MDSSLSPIELNEALLRCSETRFTEAIDIAHQLIARNPGSAQAFNVAAFAYAMLNRDAEAECCWRKAIALQPDHSEAYYNLGCLLHRCKRFVEAAEAYQQALDINPGCTGGYNNLGAVLRELGNKVGAEGAFRRAIALEPNFAEAYANLGALLEEHGPSYFEDAQFCYRKALELKPSEFGSYNLLASLFSRQGRYTESDDVWNMCIQNVRDHDEMPRLFRALFLLKHGHFDQGFRLRDELVSDRRRTPTSVPQDIPKWRGEPLAGRSIIIWTEFGYGDELMFARFVQVFKGALKAKYVGIVCQQSLFELFRGLPAVDYVISDKELPIKRPFDYWVFPHSIPVFYSIDTYGVPNATPYLFASPKRAQRWASVLGSPVAKTLRVGLVWKGNPTMENDVARSVHNLVDLAPLFEIPGVEWVSLQMCPTTSELEYLARQQSAVKLLGNQFNDFSDTAAVIEQLDLTISVCTSVAHLTGAMGKPVWLLRSAYADWRWRENSHNSDWYPSMRIFIQKYTGNWRDVAEEAGEALRCLVNRIS